MGTAGGQAAAFTYDLARSVVGTRQGNIAWAGQERDGQTEPIRSDDLFFPDWLDFSKVAIPQADEQQRLLANLITQMNLDRTPLPRFWYLPRGEKAAVVLTGDDHGNGGTAGQFDTLQGRRARPAARWRDWQCVRSTSYVYPGDQTHRRPGAGLSRPPASRSRCTSSPDRTAPRLHARRRSGPTGEPPSSAERSADDWPSLARAA